MWGPILFFSADSRNSLAIPMGFLGGYRAVTHVVSNGPAQLVHPGAGLCDLLGCTDHI